MNVVKGYFPFVSVFMSLSVLALINLTKGITFLRAQITLMPYNEKMITTDEEICQDNCVVRHGTKLEVQPDWCK